MRAEDTKGGIGPTATSTEWLFWYYPPHKKHLEVSREIPKIVGFFYIPLKCSTWSFLTLIAHLSSTIPLPFANYTYSQFYLCSVKHSPIEFILSHSFPNKNLISFDVFFQRTGPSDLYSKPPRNPLIGGGGGGGPGGPLDDLDGEFTDDETSPLTEPIYNGR